MIECKEHVGIDGAGMVRGVTHFESSDVGYAYVYTYSEHGYTFQSGLTLFVYEVDI